jgi:CRP/FNR family transcriptional regulator
MAGTAEIIPLKPRETTCPDCVFRSECLAREAQGREDTGRREMPVLPRVLHRGDHLFRTGEEFTSLYTLRSGAAKTYVILRSGEEQVIGFHTPGDVIGLDAIQSGHYACNAVLLDTSSVCPLPFDRLCRLCAESVEIQSRLVGKMSRRILDQEGLLLVLGQKTAEQRLAAFLLHHSRNQQQLGLSPCEINLAMSRADIGSYLALAVETVSRVLTRLQEAGVLSVQRSHVEILDLDGLAAIAEETIDDGLSSRRKTAGVT